MSGAAWAPGQERQFYVYSNFAQTSGNRVGFIPGRWWNPGLALTKVVNQHATSKWQVQLTIKNVSPYEVGVGATWIFGIQIGP